ncbi:hypothetical protein ACFV2X_37385 [Streptomyces sp. NPDC059679]
MQPDDRVRHGLDAGRPRGRGQQMPPSEAGAALGGGDTGEVVAHGG